MKRLNNFPAGWLCGCALLLGVSATAANLPSDWQHEQSFDVSTTGLVKISLPVETLDAARPALEDLRLYDDAGNEIPYLIERPVPIAENRSERQNRFKFRSTRTTPSSRSKRDWRSRSMASRWKRPAMDFIKAVRVESSDDGKHWQTSRARPADFSPALRRKPPANFISAGRLQNGCG